MNSDASDAAAAATASTALGENNNEHIWYFAIGSMCNPTSISNRELKAIESFPAEVMDYRLEFFGPSGVAGAVAETGKTFHGVLHKMTKGDKEKLDVIEMGYDAEPCSAKLYDGSVVGDALIYVLNPEKVKMFYNRPGAAEQIKDKPPTERYITIIIEGCEHYGVKREYIDWLKSLDYQKRKDPSELDAFAVAEDAPTMTMDDVRAADGIGDNPLYMTVNGKVIKIPKLDGPAEQMFGRYQKYKSRGVHSQEVVLHAMLYDPLFGVMKTQSDVSKLCAASTEDMIVTWSKMIGDERAASTVVGLINLQYKD